MFLFESTFYFQFCVCEVFFVDPLIFMRMGCLRSRTGPLKVKKDVPGTEPGYSWLTEQTMEKT